MMYVERRGYLSQNLLGFLSIERIFSFSAIASPFLQREWVENQELWSNDNRLALLRNTKSATSLYTHGTASGDDDLHTDRTASIIFFTLLMTSDHRYLLLAVCLLLRSIRSQPRKCVHISPRHPTKKSIDRRPV
jgi:hypothetical protein